MAEIWGAAIAAGAGLAGGALASSGAKRAARAAQAGADAATAEQRRQYDQTREDTRVARVIGDQAFNALGSIYGYSSAPPAMGDTTPTPTVGNAFAPTPGGGIDQRAALGTGVQPGAGGATALGPPMPSQPGADYSNFFASPDYQFRREQGTQGIERTASAQGLTGSGNALAALADYNSNLAAGEFSNYFNRQLALAGAGQAATNTATTAGMNASNNIGASLQNAADSRASGIADSANAWGNALGTVGGIIYDRWGRPKKTGGT